MKKTVIISIFLVLIASSLVLSLYIADQRNDAFSDILAEHPDAIYEGYHMMYKNDKGNNVVCVFEWIPVLNTNRLKQIFEFPAVEPTAERFELITEGMSLPEVVELVGLPVSNFYSGHRALQYRSADGKMYWIGFTHEDMSVTDVGLMEYCQGRITCAPQITAP